MPPTDTGTDNLAQPDDSYVHMNTEHTVSRCLCRQFCLSVINGSTQKCSLEWDCNLIIRTKPIYVLLWRRTCAMQAPLCYRHKEMTRPAAPAFHRGWRERPQLQAWNSWTLARQVSRLAVRHKTVQAWMRDEGKHGRCNAAGHKAITPTLKIIHRGQSSFMASFLDKNKKRRGGGRILWGNSREGGGGIIRWSQTVPEAPFSLCGPNYELSYF